MGPVDARIYLEEMSWNEGWNYFFLLITIRKNIRDFGEKKKKNHRMFRNLKKK